MFRRLGVLNRNQVNDSASVRLRERVLVRDVEIAWREVAGFLEGAPVLEVDVAAPAIDQSVRFQGLEHAIDVDRRQTGGIGELLLGHWQLEAVVRRHSAGLQPHREFTQDVRNAGTGIAAADVHHPFAEDRCLDETLLDDRRPD